MKASLEITGGVIRVFVRDDAAHGDPFVFMLAVVGDEGTATLKGLVALDRPLPPGIIPAVRAELRRHGFRRVRWTRRDAAGCTLREFEMDLRP